MSAPRSGARFPAAETRSVSVAHTELRHREPSYLNGRPRRRVRHMSVIGPRVKALTGGLDDRQVGLAGSGHVYVASALGNVSRLNENCHEAVRRWSRVLVCVLCARTTTPLGWD